MFIAIALWWLGRDRGVPFADAASDVYTVIYNHDLVRDGHAGAIWRHTGYYPPMTFIVGVVAMFAGGVNRVAPVVGQDLVFVSLLALGCYRTGSLLAGPRAGFLAVIFALGSPLLIEQFHVFMLDAPEAAMVAASVWLILASERFSRIGCSALAGVAVGWGLASKEQFALFVVGLLAVVLVRGQGWRNWRGILVFAGAALLVAAPWYLVNLSQLGRYASAGLANANLPSRGRPPLVSVSNLGWYLWATLNGLLFAPLFAFAVVGLVRTTSRLIRSDALTLGKNWPELLGGLLGGWLGITLTPHHDMRYTMPLIVYLAVFGTAWIVDLTPARRLLATLALGLAVIATTLGAGFGLGGEWRILLAGRPIPTDVSFGIPPPDQITVYASHDFNVSAPRRGDDVLGLFEAIRRSGATSVTWNPAQARLGDPVFDPQGLLLFARFAGLSVSAGNDATLIRRRPSGGATPCITLRDGTGVWVTMPNGRAYCPVAR